MKIEPRKLVNWYKNNLGKIVLLFIIIVIFTLSFYYIPYLNIIISPPLSFGFTLMVWYVLFSPSTKIVVILSLSILFISLFFSILRISLFAESIADVLYLFLIFILTNYVKDLWRKNSRSK